MATGRAEEQEVRHLVGGTSWHDHQWERRIRIRSARKEGPKPLFCQRRRLCDQRFGAAEGNSVARTRGCRGRERAVQTGEGRREVGVIQRAVPNVALGMRGPRGFSFPDGETEAQRGTVEANRPEPRSSHTQDIFKS